MENIKVSELSILQQKVQNLLRERSKPVNEAIQKIERMGTLLDDYVAPTTALKFHNREGAVSLMVDGIDTPVPFYGLHEHAVGQIGEKLGIPPAYLKSLVKSQDDWRRELGTEIMERTAFAGPRDRVLLRTVDGELRGFLSDKYRRLNSMEIFVAFLMAAREYENVLVDAHSGETRGFLEVINPRVIEFETPLNGYNYAVFGARLRNSDFGDGALEVRTFMLNVKCMNGLVGQSMLRELHIGGRIPENITISEETYKKDTAAKASLVKDIMAQIYSPDNTRKMIAKVTKAASITCDISREVEKLPKLGLTKGECEAVGKVLMENDPENGLQGSPTLWKLVQGMTAIARDAKPERKRELEEIAGTMLG